MKFRTVRRDEIESLYADCWLPLAEEMTALDEYNALADDIQEDALAHRYDQFDNEDAVIYVVLENSEFIGYVTAERRETPSVFQRGAAVYIEELYVGQPHRGQGIASTLIERVERWAAKRGAERVTLAVNASNEPAKALYEDHGYEIRRHKMDKTTE